MPEFTPPGILHKFNLTGEFPQHMLPIAEFQSTPEDLTKPLRGALEALLLARSSVRALQTFDRFWISQRGNSEVQAETLPISEIEKETDFEIKSNLLYDKKTFVFLHFSLKFRDSLVHELDERNKGDLPTKVDYAYDKLTDTSTLKETVDGILTAEDSLDETSDELLVIGFKEYPQVLGYNPSARQIVDLVANSYQSFAHPQTGIHQKVGGARGHIINISTEPHKVSLIDPSQYHRKEKDLSARFTNPFQNQGEDIVSNSPLQHVFETLVRKYIGS